MAIDGVTNSFAVIGNAENKFTRRWGATGADAVDPLVTGYMFAMWAGIPKAIAGNVVNASKLQIKDGSSIARILASSCVAVTLPGQTVNVSEMPGLGGIKHMYPTSVNTDNTCSTRFREWSGAPIKNIMDAWVRTLGDYRSGTRSVVEKTRFTCNIYYWTTKNDGVSIDYHCCMTGAFPTTSANDQFGFDLSSIDLLELDIEWSIDVLYKEDWTYKDCSSFANTYSTSGTNYAFNVYSKDRAAV